MSSFFRSFSFQVILCAHAWYRDGGIRGTCWLLASKWNSYGNDKRCRHRRPMTTTTTMARIVNFEFECTQFIFVLFIFIFALSLSHTHTLALAVGPCSSDIRFRWWLCMCILRKFDRAIKNRLFTTRWQYGSGNSSGRIQQRNVKRFSPQMRLGHRCHPYIRYTRSIRFSLAHTHTQASSQHLSISAPVTTSTHLLAAFQLARYCAVKKNYRTE